MRTMSEATRPENFDMMISAGQKQSLSKTSSSPWAPALAATKLKTVASVTLASDKQQQLPPRPSDVVASSSSSTDKKQQQQQPLAEPNRQQALDVVVVPKASQFVPFLDATTAAGNDGSSNDGDGLGLHSNGAVDVPGYVDLGGSGRSLASDQESATEDEDEGRDKDKDKDNLLFHLEEDATLREWMKTAHVDVQQELELAERRAEQVTHSPTHPDT